MTKTRTINNAHQEINGILIAPDDHLFWIKVTDSNSINYHWIQYTKKELMSEIAIPFVKGETLFNQALDGARLIDPKTSRIEIFSATKDFDPSSRGKTDVQIIYEPEPELIDQTYVVLREAKLMLNNQNKTIVNKTKKTKKTMDLFISHSSIDSDLAQALIEVIHNACKLSNDRIRCTSVNGYRLPAGASTDETLRLEVHEAKAFVGLITPTSISSAYVLFELGARWGLSLHLAPLLARGADPSFLRGPLAGINALNCSDRAQVYQFVSDIAKTLKVTLNNPSLYDRYIDNLVSLSEKTKAC